MPGGGLHHRDADHVSKPGSLRSEMGRQKLPTRPPIRSSALTLKQTSSGHHHMSQKLPEADVLLDDDVSLRH
jgi:hypothetical protein